MKLSEITVDAPAVISVPITFANSKEVVSVGLRMLTVRQRADALRAARAFAIEHGVPEWQDQNPICALALHVETIARAAFSVEDGVDVPFATQQQLLEHPYVGQENLAYLYEKYEEFEESQHLRTKSLSPVQVMDACFRIAQGEDDFLESLRPGIVRALLRITVGPYVSYLTSRSQPSVDESPSPNT